MSSRIRWYSLFSAALLISAVTAAAEVKINLLYPAGGETWNKGGTYTITWQVASGDPEEKIKLSIRATQKSSTFADGITAKEGRFVFETPFEWEDSKQYTVTISDAGDHELAKSKDFSMVTVPALKLRAPVGRERWVPGGTYSVAWESLDLDGKIKIELLKGGEPVGTLPSQWVENVRMHYTIPPALALGRDYSIRISSLSHPELSAESGQFSIAAAPRRTRPWGILVYLAGDNDLQAGMLNLFQRLAEVGSSEEMYILAELDRRPSEPRTFGGWYDTKRFVVRKGMQPTAERAVQDLTELNTGAPDALINFIDWGVQNYPAERYFLIINDHGYSWYARPSADDIITKGVAGDYTNGDQHITNVQLGDAFRAATGRMDIIGLDACQEGFVEVAYQLRNSGAELLVASQEMETNIDGWPYATIFEKLAARPGMSNLSLSRMACDYYIAACNIVKTQGTLSVTYLPIMRRLAAGVARFARAMQLHADNPARVKQRAKEVRSLLTRTILYDLNTSLYAPNHFGLTINFPPDGPGPTYTAAMVRWAAAAAWRRFLEVYQQQLKGTWIGDVRRSLPDKGEGTDADLLGFVRAVIRYKAPQEQTPR